MSEKALQWDHRSLDRGKIATTWDIYMLGITIVIGGQMFSWNNALEFGFNHALLSTLLMGIAYSCLTFCIAELTSTFPFSGGVYGLVRVTCDPFLGYLVAVCEVVQNIFYVAVSVIALGHMVSFALDISRRYEPLVWFLFFASACMIHCCDGNVFLKFNFVIGVISLIILVIYIISAIPQGNFHEYADTESAISGHDFMVHFPSLAWFYIGIETLPFATIYCPRPRKQIPRAMLACMGTLFCTSIGMLFAMSSQSPGTAQLAKAAIPCNFAFSRLYNISERNATWFTIIPTYATAFGFMFAFGRQISAMASSGMIPKVFKWRIPWTGATYVAILTGSAVSMAVMAIVYFENENFVLDLFHWCSLASYIVYMSSFVSFIELRRKYSTVERNFVNPLGIPGAVLGMGIFTLNFIAVLGYQKEGDSILKRMHPVIGLLVTIIAATIWYLVFVLRFQRFAVEEQKVLFSAYVIKSNLESRKKLKGRANSRSSKALLNRTTSMNSTTSTSISANMILPLKRLFSNSTMNKSLYTQTTNNPNSSSVVGSENFIAEETPSGKDISDSEKLADELGRSFHLTTLRELVQSSSSHTIAAVPSHEEDGTVGQLPIEKLFSKQHLSMQSVTSTGGHVATGDGDVEAGLGKIVVQDSTIKSIRKIRHAMSRLSFNGGSSRIAAVVDSNSMFCTSMQILPLSSSLDSEMEETAAKPTDSTVECQP